MRVKLAATHPIQYQVPWLCGLARSPGIELEVGYVWRPVGRGQGVGFDVPFEWDVPLLDGYAWTDLERSGKRPSLGRFGGLRVRRPGGWLRHGTDALIVTGWHSAALLQLAIAARRRGVPVLARGDSRVGLRGPLRQLLLRLGLRLYAAFLVVGHSNRAFYLELGVPEGRLFDCPHFVDNDRFARAAESAAGDRERVRRRWEVDPDGTAVLYCGKFIPEKNLPELIEAFGLARRNEPGLRLVLVGDGALRLELESRVAAIGGGVTFDGFRNQSELPGLYAAADLLVLPSRSESWGLVVNEAFACGLPVVASDRVGCVPDLVHPGETGELYPCGRPDELADRILRFARDPELRRRAGEAGRSLVRARYSPERAVEGTLAALAAVARAA